MVKSMTGFGKAECTLDDKKVYIEIKTLNSKQIDTNTRLPALYKEKELEIRKMISSVMHRGKIECTLYYELTHGASGKIHPTVVKDYYEQLSNIAAELGINAGELLLSTVMRFPDTFIAEKQDLDADEWALVKNALGRALDEADNFRTEEGNSLEKDLKEQTLAIQEDLSRVDPFEKERIETVREKIRTSLNEWPNQLDVDQNRFEQEVIYYLEKLDISEEKVRLANHCTYFLETMETDGPIGKKLGFISQEMGREINTLGSKANHAEIQRIVVEMKDHLERIKEQVLNVL